MNRLMSEILLGHDPNLPRRPNHGAVVSNNTSGYTYSTDGSHYFTTSAMDLNAICRAIKKRLTRGEQSAAEERLAVSPRQQASRSVVVDSTALSLTGSAESTTCTCPTPIHVLAGVHQDGVPIRGPGDLPWSPR
ncbi:MAG: hypothetical protein HY815_22475 [Candidatus Riflebacteria bacterium]|nr:hypothetical protein [Candidatus Riflebacteria bacterium]